MPKQAEPLDKAGIVGAFCRAYGAGCAAADEAVSRQLARKRALNANPPRSAAHFRRYACGWLTEGFETLNLAFFIIQAIATALTFALDYLITGHLGLILSVNIPATTENTSIAPENTTG